MTVPVPTPPGFAELPLMLADVPQVVARLLRDVGLPTRDCDEPVPPGGATGRFVLIDSRHRGATRRLRQAATESHEVLDVRDLAGRCDDLEEPNPGTRHGRRWAPAARRFVERLKQVLESRGGVWARLTDFPYPDRGVVCLAVEHPSAKSAPETWAEVFHGVDSFGPHTTHLLPLGPPPGEMEGALGGGDPSPEWGWRITPEDCASTSRKTVAAWRAALARWSRQGRVPHCLLVADSPASRRGVPSPSPQALLDLGLHVRLQRDEWGPWVGAGLAGEPVLPWVDLGLAPLPSVGDASRWVGDLYRAGQPVLVLAESGGPELAAELRAFDQACQSWPLLRRTSLAAWGHWWTARRGVEFAVWRTATGPVVQAPHPLPPGDWGWELWRGNHFAALPLTSAVQSIPENGLPLAFAGDRHPGGLSVPRTGAEIGPVPPRPRWRGLKAWLHSLTLFRDQAKGVVP